jgi:putative ABC transport system permease protein
MHDIRLAIRSLRATPIVSIVAALSLALGIGANTAIFSLVDSLVLRALPVEDPQRLVILNDSATRGMFDSSWTYATWDNLRQRASPFDAAFAWSTQRFNMASGGEIQPVAGVYVSGGYFQGLGVPALIGRMIAPEDDVRSGGRDGAVAVLSYAFWQRQFGGAADVLGRTLTLERVPFTIVGVTPPDFFGADVGRTFDVAVPFGDEPLIRGAESGLDRRSMWWLTVMLRLKPGMSLDAATTTIRGVQPQVREASMPQDWLPSLQADFLKDAFVLTPAAAGTSSLRASYRRPLLTILVVVALVLLVACANIANLLLARATARRHELSVRLALGAPRWRLARQLLVESLVLSAAGAAIGLLVAAWGSRAIVAQLSTQVNAVALDLSLDWRVLGFTAAVTTATALLFGTAPAFRAARVAPIEALKEHGRGGIGDRRVNLASGLVVAQVALSLVLIVAAGLFVRTFERLANQRLGFDRDRVLVLNVNAMRSAVASDARPDLFARLTAAAADVPAVAHASASVVTPVSGMTWNFRVNVPGAPQLSDRDRTALVNMVTPGFFATYGTRIIAGRDIDARDTAKSPHVALVNEAFAKRFFPGRTPVGGVIEFPSGTAQQTPPSQIVGVVEDAVYRNLREPIRPTMYQPLAQYDDRRFPLTTASISVRAAAGSPVLLAHGVAAAISAVDRDVAFTVRPLADQVRSSLVQERIVALLAGFFGLLALLLAGLGLYGVTTYAVTRRRTEIGIRMALGAAPAGVVRLVLVRVALLVAVGVAVGAGVSLWASRFVAALLFGLEPRDPATLAGAAAVLATVGAIAGWLPAHRASRIDPADVLRDA